MRDYTLSKAKIAELEMLHRSLRDKRQADRVKAVIAHIDGQYGVRYTLGGVTDLLHRPGFSYKKPTPVPGKQDTVKQQAFLKDEERLNARKGENDPIYFSDATHPQHNSVPAYGWIKKGQEKELKANSGRQRLNINGAINIETLEPTVR